MLCSFVVINEQDFTGMDDTVSNTWVGGSTDNTEDLTEFLGRISSDQTPGGISTIIPIPRSSGEEDLPANSLVLEFTFYQIDDWTVDDEFLVVLGSGDDSVIIDLGPNVSGPGEDEESGVTWTKDTLSSGFDLGFGDATDRKEQIALTIPKEVFTDEALFLAFNVISEKPLNELSAGVDNIRVTATYCVESTPATSSPSSVTDRNINSLNPTSVPVPSLSSEAPSNVLQTTSPTVSSTSGQPTISNLMKQPTPVTSSGQPTSSIFGQPTPSHSGQPTSSTSSGQPTPSVSGQPTPGSTDQVPSSNSGQPTSAVPTSDVSSGGSVGPRTQSPTLSTPSTSGQPTPSATGQPTPSTSSGQPTPSTSSGQPTPGSTDQMPSSISGQPTSAVPTFDVSSGGSVGPRTQAPTLSTPSTSGQPTPSATGQPTPNSSRQPTTSTSSGQPSPSVSGQPTPGSTEQVPSSISGQPSSAVPTFDVSSGGSVGPRTQSPTLSTPSTSEQTTLDTSGQPTPSTSAEHMPSTVSGEPSSTVPTSSYSTGGSVGPRTQSPIQLTSFPSATKESLTPSHTPSATTTVTTFASESAAPSSSITRNPTPPPSEICYPEECMYSFFCFFLCLFCFSHLSASDFPSANSL